MVRQRRETGKAAKKKKAKDSKKKSTKKVKSRKKAKKKAPVVAKARKKKSRVAVVEKRAELTRHIEPTDSRAQAIIKLRDSFIYDEDGQNLGFWIEHFFPGESVDQHYRRARNEGWANLREKWVRQVEARLGAELVRRQTRSRVSEIEELVTVRANALSLVTGGEDDEGNPVPLPKVKDWGQAVTAMVAADKRLDEKRDSVVAAVAGAGPPEDDGPEEDVPFTPEELRVMARAKMAMDLDKEK